MWNDSERTHLDLLVVKIMSLEDWLPASLVFVPKPKIPLEMQTSINYHNTQHQHVSTSSKLKWKKTQATKTFTKIYPL